MGQLRPEAADELGLPPGLPVATGTGDVHSAAIGSGAVADFAPHLYIGTSSWISCHVPFKKTDALRNVASIPAALPGEVPGGRRARDGRCLPHVPRPQRPLRRRRTRCPDAPERQRLPVARRGGGHGGPGCQRDPVHTMVERRTFPGRRPYDQGGFPQSVALHDAPRPGSGRLRGRGPQHQVVARRRRAFRRPAPRLPRLHRWRRQLRRLGADPRRRHGPPDPSGRRSRSRQCPGSGSPHLPGPRAS